MRTLLAVALAATLLAGCVNPDAPAADAPADATPPAGDIKMSGGTSTPDAPATGSLVVLARMPDLTALPGAKITAGNLTGVTGSDGLARFANLPPGRLEITVRKEAHRTAQLAVEIVAGQEARAEAVLPPNEEGDHHAHENGVFAHRDLYTFEGRFDCSATYLIITGDCLLVLDAAANGTGAPARPGDATSERYLIDFPLDLNWTALVAEMTWTTGAATPATGEGMTLAIEPAEAPADGHAAKYARAVGGSPLRVELHAGVKHETATADDMPNPLGGEVLRARAYVTGVGHNAGGAGFLGVGAAKDHAFTLHVSIFYGEVPPAGYTAIQGGA